MLVLFVDDDADDYDIFCEAVSLSVPNAKTLRANDGYSALVLLEELVVAPDYIFLDINMPVMNGKEFLSLIKKDQRLKDIPVIMYTTSSEEREKATFQKMGASAYIVKPTDFTTLVSVLQSSMALGGASVA
jgi:CheY-like chemotaxis protein